MSLADQLKQFEKSDRFKQKVAAARKTALSSGKSFGAGGAAVSYQKVVEYGEIMRRIVWDYVSDEIPSIALDDLYVTDPILHKDGTYEVGVCFYPEAVERESLMSEVYGGVYDIVSLFTHGWDTHGKIVKGMWHDRMTKSLPYREGSSFMQDAANEFMRQVPNTHVELHEKYTDPNWIP